MSKARNILGVISGVILILSSGAHSFLGWKAMHEQLAAIDAPEELVTGLAIGWNFAGFAIFIFGVLLLLTFIPRLRGLYASLTTARVIGWAYLASGGVAYAVSRMMFFISVFVVPGILILLSSSERDEA